MPTFDFLPVISTTSSTLPCQAAVVAFAEPAITRASQPPSAMKSFAWRPLSRPTSPVASSVGPHIGRLVAARPVGEDEAFRKARQRSSPTRSSDFLTGDDDAVAASGQRTEESAVRNGEITSQRSARSSSGDPPRRLGRPRGWNVSVVERLGRRERAGPHNLRKSATPRGGEARYGPTRHAGRASRKPRAAFRSRLPFASSVTRASQDRLKVRFRVRTSARISAAPSGRGSGGTTPSGGR